MDKPAVQSDLAIAYMTGRAAGLWMAVTPNDCPHASGELRLAWLHGYREGRANLPPRPAPSTGGRWIV